MYAEVRFYIAFSFCCCFPLTLSHSPELALHRLCFPQEISVCSRIEPFHGLQGNTCSTMVFSGSCMGIPASVSGAHPPLPSSLTLVSALWFLTLVHSSSARPAFSSFKYSFADGLCCVLWWIHLSWKLAVPPLFPQSSTPAAKTLPLTPNTITVVMPINHALKWDFLEAGTAQYAVLLSVEVTQYWRLNPD